jgi:hypothetical protein
MRLPHTTEGIYTVLGMCALRDGFVGGAGVGTEGEKRIIVRIDPNDETITLKDIMQKIQEIQRQHPDLDVFFDGDEYAVCSRPKKKD